MRALLFDLDGTLVDNVYAHTWAWQRTFAEVGLTIEACAIHRRIGMSGSIFVPALAREHGRQLTEADVQQLENRHGQIFREISPRSPPLPGARELLHELRAREIPHAIATTGRPEEIAGGLQALGDLEGTPVIDRSAVKEGKPEPDLLLVSLKRLRVDPEACYMVGDAVWDLLAARRARMLGVGVLTGGTSADELERAGAYRVYAHCAQLLAALDELGLTRS